MPKRSESLFPGRSSFVYRISIIQSLQYPILNSLNSPRSRRNYKFAMEQFTSWYCSEPLLALNRTVVLRFRLHLESLGLAAGTINQRLAAVRRLAYEAVDSGLIWSDRVNLCDLWVFVVVVFVVVRGQSEQQSGQFSATIDQSDIRGPEPHNLDPSGAASDCCRESG
jgi:hypothetical protein